MLIADSSPFLCHKYTKKVGKDLIKRLEIACKFHDSGKKHSKWQEACRKDYENYVSWKKRTGGNFQEYQKQFNEQAGKYLRKAGIRHEFQSLIFHEGNNLPFPLQAAIGAHHGKLNFQYEERWKKEGAGKFWANFRKESNRISENESFKEVVKTHYEYSAVRGLLQLADHRASAIEEGYELPEFAGFEYKFPWKEKRSVQKLVDEHSNESLLLIRAPTGAGKTDAALLWASKQIQEHKKADRLVIAMPTRFTSNALSISVTENLSQTGLYHSSAWSAKFHKQIEKGETTIEVAKKEHEFARLLQTPATICTIDHLLMALTLTREDHHLISFNLANSCLVIDEADFYDDFTQANIIVLLEALSKLQVPVLIMSASLPESITKLYSQTGYELNDIKEDISGTTEPRFEVKSIAKYTKVSELESYLKVCKDKENAIIYANTVDKALEFYNWFDDKDDVILYHSQFTEPDKKRKEDDLLTRLGPDAWENNTAKGIAILTQIGEMSINISADVMISDICPIDRLTQRVGRLCRFDNQKLGALHILKPLKDRSLYPAPYGNYDRKNKEWIPAKALEESICLIEKKEYSSKELVDLINKIYSYEKIIPSSYAQENAKRLREHFSYNWLITSKQISKEDDTDTNFWSSRDIPSQDTVFVSMPDKTYFENYLAFQNWKIENSIELPVYLIEKGRKNHIIDLKELRVKEDMIKIYILREGFYSYEFGIKLTSESQFL
ncbi:MAG: CRISPR-associated helicase Cas3' [Bacteroidetes bacterium SW_11_45_7]|nr:MAG: CRISPR-associated helicase Cas3' [Bacteroidetes bacterium SW_11_45_7]